MGRRLFVTVLVICSGLVVSAAAAQPGSVVHDRYSVDQTFILTRMCPFPVVERAVGEVDDAYFFDAGGSLTRVHETVHQALITYAANGKSLDGRGSGGFDVQFNPDGTRTVSTFGINVLVVIPGQGPVILDAGRSNFSFDPRPHLVFQAGPQDYDLAAFCAALAP